MERKKANDNVMIMLGCFDDDRPHSLGINVSYNGGPQNGYGKISNVRSRGNKTPLRNPVLVQPINPFVLVFFYQAVVPGKVILTLEPNQPLEALTYSNGILLPPDTLDLELLIMSERLDFVLGSASLNTSQYSSRPAHAPPIILQVRKPPD